MDPAEPIHRGRPASHHRFGGPAPDTLDASAGRATRGNGCDYEAQRGAEGMSDEMKPCPFCGSDVCTVQQSFQCEYVQCDRCEAMGPAGKTTDDAIAEWNRRSGDPK
ncbi:hypothetical protein CYJ10_29355 [Cupriavidus pauculus]|uniref:Restriction alleviation protein, Lar family n=2 Tax=Cupriavidus pauculus TaxID=82633 RepID=A0A2N5C414_9BURK|nr:hypothetical protein CYJ10_29355 [Cupriavidus pauculus]